MLWYLGIAAIVNTMQMYVASRRTDFHARKQEYVYDAIHKGILWPIYVYSVVRDFIWVTR